MVRTATLSLETRGHADLHDITSRLEQAVAESGISAGIAAVFAPSSTSALITLENESGVVEDLRRLLDELVDPAADYRHNLRWGDGNGHAHLRSALLGTSLAIPIVDGRLTLGSWQQVFYIDFDVRARQRRIVVQMLGE